MSGSVIHNLFGPTKASEEEQCRQIHKKIPWTQLGRFIPITTGDDLMQKSLRSFFHRYNAAHPEARALFIPNLNSFGGDPEDNKLLRVILNTIVNGPRDSKVPRRADTSDIVSLALRRGLNKVARVATIINLGSAHYVCLFASIKRSGKAHVGLIDSLSITPSFNAIRAISRQEGSIDKKHLECFFQIVEVLIMLKGAAPILHFVKDLPFKADKQLGGGNSCWVYSLKHAMQFLLNDDKLKITASLKSDERRAWEQAVRCRLGSLLLAA